MKNIKDFINESLNPNSSFEDWVKSLKFPYTKEIRKTDEISCPICDDECDQWEEYSIDASEDYPISFAYCNDENEFTLCIDATFVDIKDKDFSDDPIAYKFPKDTELFTPQNIKKAVKKYENY